VEEKVEVIVEETVVEAPRDDLKSKLEYMSIKQKNPFSHIRNWIKGEIYQGNALVEAIKDKDNME